MIKKLKKLRILLLNSYLYPLLLKTNSKIIKEYLLPRKIKNGLIFYEAVNNWFKINGDDNLRYNYPNLNEESIVFDIGGYHGNFALKIYEKYKSNIYVFEPVTTFCEIIKNKIKNIDKITLLPYGLGSKNFKTNIALLNDSASTFRKSKNYQTIEIKDIVEFMELKNIETISLVKINIEGGEFDLLESIIANNLAYKFENIQVQFHRDIKHAHKRMMNIRNNLLSTHHLTFCYDFVWENYELRK
jgi:FkbM family methyltransferase